MSRPSQQGFSLVELIIIIVVVATLVFVGVVVVQKQRDNSTDNSATSSLEESATATDVGSAPAVNSTEDLDTAQAMLDQTDPAASNSADVTQLDEATATF